MSCGQAGRAVPCASAKCLSQACPLWSLAAWNPVSKCGTPHGVQGSRGEVGEAAPVPAAAGSTRLMSAVAKRPGTPAVSAGSATTANGLVSAQPCPGSWAPLGWAARGSSPALDIASVPLPHTPCGHPCSQDGDEPRGPLQSQSAAGSGRCLEDAPGAGRTARAWHGHSLDTAVPWRRSGQCHLPGCCLELLGEAGREGTGSNRRDGGDSTMARWSRKLSALPNPASHLRAGLRGQQGRDGASAGARALAAPRSAPRWRPEKGHGAGGCCHCCITHRICCQQSPERHLPAPLLAPSPSPAATQGPCKVTATMGPCKAPRQSEAGA